MERINKVGSMGKVFNRKEFCAFLLIDCYGAFFILEKKCFKSPSTYVRVYCRQFVIYDESDRFVINNTAGGFNH